MNAIVEPSEVGSRAEINPFPNDKILEITKLKEFADDNFKLDENGRKFF